MKKMKSLFYVTVITLFMIIIFSGAVYSASVTLQRESALQNAQERAVVKNDLNGDGNPLHFAPSRLKDKSDSGMESGTVSRPLRMERYKPYKEGEGDRKVRSDL